MSYTKRLDRAFENAPVLPVTPDTKYVFFSDCHRGVGNNNDNFLKNANNYYAALQYYYQYGFCYVEAGDGDELWENRSLTQIMEAHHDIFYQLCCFHRAGLLYMLYGNHDTQAIREREQAKLARNKPVTSFPVCPRDKMSVILQEQACFPIYDGLIFRFQSQSPDLYVTHGHQADFFNSVLWRLGRFLVRYLWTPLEYFGALDPTSAAKNNTKKEKLEKKYIKYAQNADCLLLTGHTHRPTLGDTRSPYYNCGSCVHPKCITCIELCGYQMHLVKWYASAEKSEHFGNIYAQCPPVYPVYIKREVLSSQELL